MKEKISVISSLCPQIQFTVEEETKKDFWMDVETVRTSGKIDEFLNALNNIKRIYPDIVLTFDSSLEYTDEISEIRISTDQKGEYIGLITYNEYDK